MYLFKSLLSKKAYSSSLSLWSFKSKGSKSLKEKSQYTRKANNQIAKTFFEHCCFVIFDASQR
jgi:hypothetical protein